MATEKFEIMEQFCRGKLGSETCEDGMAIGTAFVAVIDGSTSKTPFRLDPSMTNGRFAMLAIRNCLLDGTLPAEATADDFCDGITDRLRREYDRHGMTATLLVHPEQRPCASVVVLSVARHELWLVGDCQVLVDGKLHENGKPYESQIAARRAALIRQGTPPDEARRAIEPLLIDAMREGQNRSYAVVDGFPIYKKGVKVVPLPPHAEVVLASDGYPFLRPTLSASEDALARQLRDDPQNVDTFIATKGLKPNQESFDDRTYVRVRL